MKRLGRVQLPPQTLGLLLGWTVGVLAGAALGLLVGLCMAAAMWAVALYAGRRL